MIGRALLIPCPAGRERQRVAQPRSDAEGDAHWLAHPLPIFHAVEREPEVPRRREPDGDADGRRVGAGLAAWVGEDLLERRTRRRRGRVGVTGETKSGGERRQAQVRAHAQRAPEPEAISELRADRAAVILHADGDPARFWKLTSDPWKRRSSDQPKNASPKPRLNVGVPAGSADQPARSSSAEITRRDVSKPAPPPPKAFTSANGVRQSPPSARAGERRYRGGDQGSDEADAAHRRSLLQMVKVIS